MDEDAFHQDLLNSLHRQGQIAENRDKFECYCKFINPKYWTTYAEKEKRVHQYADANAQKESFGLTPNEVTLARNFASSECTALSRL